MDYESFFAERLAALRTKAGVSARDMSLSMGQSAGYIHKIESRQNLPSMTGFFYICEFLGIEPKDFFDISAGDPKQINEIAEQLKRLSDKQLKTLSTLIDTMLNPK